MLSLGKTGGLARWSGDRLGTSALDAGIELSLEQVPQRLVVVHGVEALVRSALASLVGNALIHARGASRIVANLSRGGVSISDDGPGIPHYCILAQKSESPSFIIDRPCNFLG
jgi:signal transduction histidine kinase